MSSVTSVLITATHHPEEHGIKAVNDWLEAQNKPPLVEISRHAVGKKAFGSELWAGGINYLDEPKFTKVVQSVNWSHPDFVQVFIKGEIDDRFRQIKIET